jgi:hypothetical protein
MIKIPQSQKNVDGLFDISCMATVQLSEQMQKTAHWRFFVNYERVLFIMFHLFSTAF